MSQDDKDQFPKIVEHKGDSLCTACEDRLTKTHYSVGGRVLCWTCAKEIAYGVVPPGLPIHQFGGGDAGPQDEDANGCRSNAMRALEE